MKFDDMIKMRNSKLLDLFITQGYFPHGTAVSSTAVTEQFNNWLELNGLWMRKVGQHTMSCLMRNNDRLTTWRNPPECTMACLKVQPVVI